MQDGRVKAVVEVAGRCLTAVFKSFDYLSRIEMTISPQETASHSWSDSSSCDFSTGVGDSCHVGAPSRATVSAP